MITQLNSGFFDTASLSGGGSFDKASNSGSTVRPRAIAIIKEVAPVKDAKTDAELGVNEFQTKYFGNNPVYLDRDKNCYKALGSRKLLSQSLSSYNPFTLWKNFKSLLARVKGKGIEGNLNGEGFLQGGIMLFNNRLNPNYEAEDIREELENLGLSDVDLISRSKFTTDCFYVYLEQTGDEIPITDIQTAIYKNPDI